MLKEQIKEPLRCWDNEFLREGSLNLSMLVHVNPRDVTWCPVSSKIIDFLGEGSMKSCNLGPHGSTAIACRGAAFQKTMKSLRRGQGKRQQQMKY